MTPEDRALADVVEALKRQGVDYMVTGSVASSYYGHPRTTHDADVVIDPTRAQLTELVRDLEAAGFYADADAAAEALRERRQFNVIQIESACKIDLIIRKDRPFSAEEFSRRTATDLPFGRNIALVTAEDSVISKLEWASRGGTSERQLRDIAGILELNPGIDRAYIERWVAALQLETLWQRARSDTDVDR